MGGDLAGSQPEQGQPRARIGVVRALPGPRSKSWWKLAGIASIFGGVWRILLDAQKEILLALSGELKTIPTAH